MEQADAVVYDALVSAEILSLIPEKTEKINVGNGRTTIWFRRRRSIRFWLTLQKKESRCSA